MLPVRNVKGRVVLWILLMAFMGISVLPVVWTALQSLKTEFQATARTPVFIFDPTPDNYKQIWFNSWSDKATYVIYGLCAFVLVLVMLRMMADRLPWSPRLTSAASLAAVVIVLFAVPHLLDTSQMYIFFMNSVIISALTTVFSVGLAIFSGYALARYVGRSAIVVLLAAVALRALPRTGFVLPYYWIAQKTGLFDTKLLIVATLTALNQPFSMWLLRGFFRDIPQEIEEAAMMDGANRFTAFLRVILPSAWPGIVASGLFTLLLAYQEFLLITVLAQNNSTLAVAGAQYLGGRGVATQIAVQAAAAVSATLPVIVVVLIFQKHLVRGLSAGAVKG